MIVVIFFDSVRARLFLVLSLSRYIFTIKGFLAGTPKVYFFKKPYKSKVDEKCDEI